MQILLEVIVPVFIVIGFGYLVTWRKLFSDSAVDGVMRFTQNFAVPCLLFRGISQLDLKANFDFSLLSSFYGGAVGGFILGLLVARYVFKRDWEDSVAIGFCCLFSNSLLLGIPITERAYGEAALTNNYAIIAMHSPFCYGLGITAMEIARAQGAGPAVIAPKVLKAMFRNPLILGISTGLVVNLTGLTLPTPLNDAIDMMIRSAIPVALFGLGGVLYRYRPEGDLKTIAFVCFVSLVVHPSISWTLGHMQNLNVDQTRSLILTASMAPGVNAYLFANMYGRARRVAASAVLLATAGSIITVWGWLSILP